MSAAETGSPTSISFFLVSSISSHFHFGLGRVVTKLFSILSCQDDFYQTASSNLKKNRSNLRVTFKLNNRVLVWLYKIADISSGYNEGNTVFLVPKRSFLFECNLCQRKFQGLKLANVIQMKVSGETSKRVGVGQRRRFF